MKEKYDDEFSETSINYGTHTLPKKFWTSGKPSILKDEAFRARRKAKNDRNRKRSGIS